MNIVNKIYSSLKELLNRENTKAKKKQNWDSIEKRYIKMEFKDDIEMVHLIKSIRERGFDNTFYASTSLQSLLISKSEYDFHKNPNLSFSPLSAGGLAIRRSNEKGDTLLLQLPKCEYCSEIEELLNEFKNS